MSIKPSSRLIHYSISGTVQHWNKRWRILGFPTLNITHSSTTVASWTYLINTIIWSRLYLWVGVYFQDRGLLEVHCIWLEWDWYWEKAECMIVTKFRDTIQFSSDDALQAQLTLDLHQATQLQIQVLTFWTFDHFHPGHTHYLRQAWLHWTHLTTIVALDKTVETLKHLTPTYTQDQRVRMIKPVSTTHTVQLWDPNNPYSCLEQRKPDVICLWYDQHWFAWGIEKRYTTHDLSVPKIIRISSHSPELYKSSILRWHL